MRPYKNLLKTLARELRANQTEAEDALWHRLRRKQIAGLQFYRQKPLLSFIVDFYCPAAELVIELDGSQHLEHEHQERDRERDARLSAIGLLVLRFDNRQVLLEVDGVLSIVRDTAIQRAVKIREKSPPTPLFKGGRPEGPRADAAVGAEMKSPFEKGGFRGIFDVGDPPFVPGDLPEKSPPTPLFQRGET